MTKKDTFRNLIRYEVAKALLEAYGFNSYRLTDAQERLVVAISDKLYELFGDTMTVKELKERINAISNIV